MTITGLLERQTPLETLCKQDDLDPERIPKHIAVIMDGNGRWAKERGLKRTEGHVRGAETLRRTIGLCADYNVHYLSVYTFSTENWSRPQEEVDFLMSLIEDMTTLELPALLSNGVRVRSLGDWSQFSPSLAAGLKNSETETAHCTTLQLNLMINYGGRRELAHAMSQCHTFTEAEIEKHLYTAGIPDPDLLIRTGGDHRLSNFMLWQLSYAELFFIDTLWPDFGKSDFVSILHQFQHRDRRFGGLK